MKNLMKLVEECQKELDTINIEYRSVRHWHVNRTAKCRWGRCKQISNGVYDISISDRLLADGIDDTAVKSTIIHELLHTVKGGFGHKGIWRALANRVNQAYPQYTIKRCSSYTEKGIEQINTTCSFKYEIICTVCGTSIYRQKRTKVVANIEKYRCCRCGGKLHVAGLLKN